MPVQTYDKFDIARQQLQTALRLYREGADYLSVITLAGAAEEILGKSLRAMGCDNSLDLLQRAADMISQRLFNKPVDTKAIVNSANRAKNNLKHFDCGAGAAVKIDPHEEAKDMLNRAVDNYLLLEEDLTPDMEEFEREQLRT